MLERRTKECRRHKELEDHMLRTQQATWRGKAARAALLCPGPSLSDFADRSDYDLRIGVNRAAGAFRCDFWVALDVHTAGVCSPLGNPVIVCRGGAYSRMCKQFPYVAKLHHLSSGSMRLPATGRDRISWSQFSATVALVLAAELGARDIDCYGVDWRGKQDFDGFTSDKNHRDEKRWQREQELWARVVDVLAARGVTVRRMGAKAADSGGIGESCGEIPGPVP